MGNERSTNLGEVIERLRRSTVHVRTEGNGAGSGVIWSEEGQIVTNAHVVEGARNASRVEVELWDGRRLPARVTAKDRRRDVAALKIDSGRLVAARLGDSNRLRAGELVIAVGNPLGFTGAASTGLVHGGSGADAWVVSQLRLAPGNSGGPLANVQGEVVGINTMISGGLSFAVPTAAVEEFLRQPVRGQVGLGVVVRPVVVDKAGRQLGFVVLEVIPQSPADYASLLQGDVLLGLSGKPFQSARELEEAIQASSHGTLELQFRRGANPNLRAVTIRMTPATVRAA